MQVNFSKISFCGTVTCFKTLKLNSFLKGVTLDFHSYSTAEVTETQLLVSASAAVLSCDITSDVFKHGS